MGIDYEDGFDKHNPKKKVGVIQKAWIDGNKLMCSGIIWKKDFPDVKDALKDKQLGMSFEGSNISVEDPKADVWKITDVCFTGAAILYKTAAAYQKTEALAAAADNRAICAELVYIHTGGKAMSQKANNKDRKHSSKNGRRSVSAAGENEKLVGLVAASLQTALKPLVATQKTLTKAILASIEDREDESSVAAAASVLAKGKKKGMASSSSSEEESSEEAASASSSAAASASSSAQAAADKRKKKKVHAAASSASSSAAASAESAASSAEASAASSSAAASAASDEDELESMSSSEASASETPGSLNKNANTNKGSKTTVTKGKLGKKSPMGAVKASASNSKLRKIIKKIAAQAEETEQTYKKSVKKLRREVKELRAQAEEAGKAIDRKSIAHPSPRLDGLLAKGAVDISAMAAAGEKVSVDEFDALLDKVPGLSSTDRMSLKAEATHAGIMDEGRISR